MHPIFIGTAIAAVIAFLAAVEASRRFGKHNRRMRACMAVLGFAIGAALIWAKRLPHEPPRDTAHTVVTS
ncbi:MAG: hypothetical protein KF718_15090 [Polyangiaceae bacterium]|nr:hypothetical protein [Polyangiaceae bacterium]